MYNFFHLLPHWKVKEIGAEAPLIKTRTSLLKDLVPSIL